MPPAGDNNNGETMKKRISALIFFLVFPILAFAEGSFSAGSFISASQNSGYSPSFIYTKGDIDYLFNNGAFISSDIDFLYGFTSAKDADRVFTNYLNGSIRLMTGYDHKNKIYTGSVTNLSFFSDNDDYSARISQGNALSSMERNMYITEELFLNGSLLDKKLNFSVDLGYKFQQFSELENFSSDGNKIKYNGYLQDSDVFAFTKISYGSFIAPFAEIRLGNDLNEDNTFNLGDYRFGLEGDVKTADTKFRLIYQAYYKRLQSDIINENNRLVLYSRFRYSPVQFFDMFFDGYLEYSVDDQGNPFFVNRNFTLLGRFWPFEKLWSISTGITVIFDHATDYDANGTPHGSLFVPLWPFIRTDVYFYKSGSVFKNFRGFAKFTARLGEFQGDYSNYALRTDAGICTMIGFVEPAVSLRWLTSGAQLKKTGGIDLSLTARF